MKNIFLLILPLFILSETKADGPGQAAPAQPQRPVLTLREYQRDVVEDNFAGCPSSSVLTGTGNPGRQSQAQGTQRRGQGRGQR